jgi:hypothetical protein
LFAFVISLVVVGAAVALTTRIVVRQTSEHDQPATPHATEVRGRSSERRAAQAFVPASAPGVDLPLVPSAFRRIRSAVLLVAIVTILGALTALLVVIGGAIVLTGVRNAVQ